MAAVFVIVFSDAAAVFFVFSILPLPWAVSVTIGLSAVATLLVKDIRGNRAM